jgi:hypothetical protein
MSVSLLLILGLYLLLSTFLITLPRQCSGNYYDYYNETLNQTVLDKESALNDFFIKMTEKSQESELVPNIMNITYKKIHVSVLVPDAVTGYKSISTYKTYAYVSKDYSDKAVDSEGRIYRLFICKV